MPLVTFVTSYPGSSYHRPRYKHADKWSISGPHLHGMTAEVLSLRHFFSSPDFKLCSSSSYIFTLTLRSLLGYTIYQNIGNPLRESKVPSSTIEATACHRFGWAGFVGLISFVDSADDTVRRCFRALQSK